LIIAVCYRPAKKSTSGLLSRAVLQNYGKVNNASAERERERERRKKKRLSPVLFLLLCVRFSLLLALCFSLLFRCPALLGFFLSLPRFLLLPSATDGGTRGTLG
jgi:hypothetical protein